MLISGERFAKLFAKELARKEFGLVVCPDFSELNVASGDFCLILGVPSATGEGEDTLILDKAFPVQPRSITIHQYVLFGDSWERKEVARRTFWSELLSRVVRNRAKLALSDEAEFADSIDGMAGLSVLDDLATEEVVLTISIGAFVSGFQSTIFLNDVFDQATLQRIVDGSHVADDVDGDGQEEVVK